MAGQENWSISLPKGSNFTAVPPNRIRHNIGFGYELYLQSLSQPQPNKTVASLIQVVATDDGQLTTHTILDRFDWQTDTDKPLTLVCIDEVAQKLYVCVETKNLALSLLLAFGVTFGRPDALGYRRATRVTGHVNILKLSLELPLYSLSLCPNTGRMLCSMGPTHNWGILDLTTSQSGTFGAQVVSQSVNQNIVMATAFKKRGKQLLVFSKTSVDCVRTTVALYSVERFDVVWRLEYENLRLSNLYPPDSWYLASGAFTVPPLSQTIKFCGRIYKYSFFHCYFGSMGIIRHFEKWITDPNKEHHFFETLGMPTLPSGFEPSLALFNKIKVLGVVGCAFYYIESDNRLHRFEFDQYLKDYRVCAHCGLSETKKRHNAKGARIANYKVCRKCKALTLHHQWREFPCHFCSEECRRKHGKHTRKYTRSLISAVGM